MDPCISSLAQGTSKASRVLSTVSAARRPIVRTRVSGRLIDGGLSLSNKMTGVSEKSLTSKILESLDALHVSMNIFWGAVVAIAIAKAPCASVSQNMQHNMHKEKDSCIHSIFVSVCSQLLHFVLPNIYPICRGHN